MAMHKHKNQNIEAKRRWIKLKHHTTVRNIQSNRYETYYWTGEKLRFTFMNLTNGERARLENHSTNTQQRKKQSKEMKWNEREDGKGWQ